jgi:hypothetical protein
VDVKTYAMQLKKFSLCCYGWCIGEKVCDESCRRVNQKSQRKRRSRTRRNYVCNRRPILSCCIFWEISTAFKPTELILVSTSKEEYDGGSWCLIWQHGGRRKISGRHDEKYIQTDRFIKAVHKPFDTGTAVTILDK